MGDINYKAIINVVINLQDTIDYMEEVMGDGLVRKRLMGITRQCITQYEALMNKWVKPGTKQSEVYDIIKRSVKPIGRFANGM